jgi:hypothetical protein
VRSSDASRTLRASSRKPTESWKVRLQSDSRHRGACASQPPGHGTGRSMQGCRTEKWRTRRPFGVYIPFIRVHTCSAVGMRSCNTPGGGRAETRGGPHFPNQESGRPVIGSPALRVPGLQRGQAHKRTPGAETPGALKRTAACAPVMKRVRLVVKPGRARRETPVLASASRLRKRLLRQPGAAGSPGRYSPVWVEPHKRTISN